MSRNGSGTYNLPAGNPVVSGTTITSSWANNTLSDIATALTGSVASDGQTPMTGELSMGTNKITSLGTPSASTDASTKGYVDTAIATQATTDAGLYLAKASNLSDVANATTARGNLTAAKSGSNSDITELTGLTTPLSASQGGTGASSLPAGGLVGVTATQTLTNKTLTTPIISTISNTGTLTLPTSTDTLVGRDTTDTLTNKTLTSPVLNSPTISGTPTVSGSLIVQGTAVTASGINIDFTSIPSWVKRITVMFNGVSTNGSSAILVRLGTAASIPTTGYNSNSLNLNGSTPTYSSAGLLATSTISSSGTYYGSMVISNVSTSSNGWVSTANIGGTSTASGALTGGVAGGGITLADTLTRIRITTVSGDTFDAGTINILYE